MQAAYDRCFRAVPVTMDNLRPTTGRVALRCFRSQCPLCRAHETSGRKEAFEATLNATHILPWNCDDPSMKSQALEVGVDALPAYILLTPQSTRVVRPALE